MRGPVEDEDEGQPGAKYALERGAAPLDEECRDKTSMTTATPSETAAVRSGDHEPERRKHTTAMAEKITGAAATAVLLAHGMAATLWSQRRA
jgi:hypothetical protein